jgi:hypothetical protein
MSMAVASPAASVRWLSCFSASRCAPSWAPPIARNDQLAAAALQPIGGCHRPCQPYRLGHAEQQRIAATGEASASDEVIYASVNGIEPVWGFWSTHGIHRYVLTNPRLTEIGISAYTAGSTTYYTADFGKP